MSLPTKWAQSNGVHCDASLPSVVMRTDVGPSRILCFSDHPISISDTLSSSSPTPNENLTVRHIDISDTIYYFEVEILSNVNEGGSAEISVGIAPVDRQFDVSRMGSDMSFGAVGGSASYSNTGEISIGSKIYRAVKFGTHDVVGCGFAIGGDGRIFFTCNGKVVTEQGNAISIDVDLIDQMFYYPAVEILGVGTTVKANFGADKFQFNVRDPMFSTNYLSVSQVPSADTVADVKKNVEVVPPPILGHAQSHSFISRISSQLSQPLFSHSQSDPSCALSRTDAKDLSDLQDLQSEDYLVAIASALSLEPTDTVISSLDIWTDSDYTQATEAVQLLRELVESRPTPTDLHKTEGQSFEAMSALCETLTDLQGRLRRYIDKSPENGSHLELNDMITEILLEVAELKEVIGGTDVDISLSKTVSSGVSASTNPSLVSIMYMLRRGTKEEVLGSVSQILLKCNLEENEFFSPRKSPVATKSINDIRVAGGLQTLVSTLHRCVSWPDVELQVSLAIAILVSYETDWHILMKESHAVLSSMQVLLLRKNEIQFSMNCSDVENHKKKLYCLVSSAVRRFCALLYAECLKPNMKTSTLSSLHSESNILSESPQEIIRKSANSSMMTPTTDEAYLCRTLETLVHIIQTLCEESVHDSTDVKNVQNPSGKIVELSTNDIIRQTREIRNSSELCSANCGSEEDDTIGLKSQIFSSEILTRSRSTPDLKYPVNNIEEKKTDSAVNASTLSDDFLYNQGRTRSSSLNAMPSSCDAGTVSCLVDDVVILCSHSLRDLCRIEDFHAPLVAGDVLLLLVKWLTDSTIILRKMQECNLYDSQSCRFSVDHPVTELVDNVTAALVSITAPDGSSIFSSTSPDIPGFRRSSFNQKQSNYTIGWIDAQVMAVELPVALVAFIDLIAQNRLLDSSNKLEHSYHYYEKLGVAALVTSLISLASRSQNRASLLNCGAPNSILRLLTAVVSQHKCGSFNSTKEESDGSGQNEGGNVADMQLISDFNESLAGQCLDFVSFFLADNIADISKSAIVDKPPDIVNFFMQPPVFNSLVKVFSFQPCLARLQAVRVLSMLVEWQQVMELLYQEGISTALSVLLEDANERYEYEMISEDDEFSKLSSRMIDDKAAFRPTASRYVLEETMRACYALAHLCHSKLIYALQCFENGLMTIMLRTLRHDNIEVQRQSIRCISGMCPVLSVLTPGGHPSLMIASLKSESSTFNPARSQSGSATEARAIAKKLHSNVIDFVNALRALTDALSSPNMLIKMDALRGISYLAKDDHLRVGIVEGPLSLIIALLLDPQCETDLQQLAESVLVNIGFVGGRDDLAVVCNDPYLLSEWFYIRRSLRLQKSCHDLLGQWIDGCFFGCDIAEKRAKQLYIAELGREVALADNVDDEDSLLLHFPEGIDIDIRDTVDLVGLSVVTNVIEKIVEKRRHRQDISLDAHDTSLPLTAPQQSTDLRDALLLQFTHLFDAWMLLRNQQTSTSALNLPSDTFPSIASNEWIKDKSENYFNFSPGGSGKKKTTGHITDRFFAFMTLCTGRGAQRVVDEENEEAHKLDKFANDKVKAHSMERDDRSLNISNYDYSLRDLDDWLNIPPPKVSECLDLFFPSKLHQSVVCDLFSIGRTSDVNSVSTRQSNVLSTPPRTQHLDHAPHRVPEPKQFRCVVFPSRTYFSFAREGRVLKKILDDVTNVEKKDVGIEASTFGGYADANKTLWALSFRNSVFHGEFIMTLVNTLRSLPQISSLSFVCKAPQDDSELGYFGGNVPATVRFLTFQNALSSSAIDALCTYLRAQNISFRQNSSDCSTTTEEEPSSPISRVNQGLVGLGITCSGLTTEDVSNICVLLKGSVRGEESIDESLSKGAYVVDGSEPGHHPLPGIPAAQYMCGLRFLDLSHNKLSDEQCSNIISASVNTPLEGLEMKGNYVHRGLYFCPVLKKQLSSRKCRLQFLGVSANGIINTTFRSILDCCQYCNCLTNVDLSYNGLTSSEKNCDRVREFLKSNSTLRILNLSHNRFTYGMTRIFHLGLLENESLVMLRLDGNISMNEREMYLVRGKLKANRDRYVRGHHSSLGHPTAPHTTNAEREYQSKRRSESSTLGSAKVSSLSTQISSNLDDYSFKFDKARNSVGSGEHDVRSVHDRTLVEAEEKEPSNISDIATTVVATEVVIRDVNDDVPLSTAFYPAVETATAESREEKLQVPLVATQTICVLFSAPLAWTDTKNRLHPIQTLDYPGERDTLIQAFREASRDIGVRFDFATTDTLRTALSLGVKVLHFSGHGHPHCLNFEDGRSGLQFVTMDALRSLCTAGGNQLEFVFVSACHSRRAGETFVGAGVPHVVCVNVDAQLLDAAAMAFTRAFYLALAVGRTVSQSFDIGKQAVFNSPYVPNSLAEGEKFLLLPEGSNHDTPVFRAKAVSHWPIPGSSLTGLTCDLVDNSYLPHIPEDFEGREVDMYSTIRILLSRRLVTIVGENGVGKSSVAIAVCSYLAERRKFENGVIFARMRGVATHEDFLLSLVHAIKYGSPPLASQFMSLRGKDKSVLPIRDQEELLLAFLAPLKALIVLGNISGLLAASSETSTDLKMFLGRLFDRCKKIKILTTANTVIGMTGFGIVEHVVSLGPLSLYSSLRLFARLSPVLATAALKVQFVKALLIPEQSNVTLESRELSAAAAQILYMLGGGHPSKIVKIACESSTDRIDQMKMRATSNKEK